MKRTCLSRLASAALALTATLGLVLDAPCLVGFSKVGTSVAEARPGGGPRGGGPRGDGPRGGGPRPEGGLRYGGGPPQGPRPSVRPPGHPGGPPPGGGPGYGPRPGPGPRPVPPPPPPPGRWGPGYGPRPYYGPPIAAGAWLWTLPATAVALTVAGSTYYKYNSSCYIGQYQGDQLVYVPVQGPCPPPAP